MPRVLALDQGTTSSRALVFDRRGRAIATAQQEFAQHFPRPGWVEHDPRDLWESVRRTALLKDIPYFTTTDGARAAAGAIEALRAGPLTVRSLQEYLG